MSINKFVRFADGFFLVFANLPVKEEAKYPTHEAVAKCHPNSHVISAGFILIDGDTINCHGESSTLGIGVRNDDEEFFQEMLQ